MTGVGRKMREKLPTCKIVAVDPYGSLLAEPGSLNVPSFEFKVEGSGYDFMPLNMDRKVADFWMKHND